MSLVLVRQALEVRLNAMAPALDTAWENNSLPVGVATPFQEVALMPAEPDNSVFGTNYQERGLFQITLNYPLKKGPGDAAARAELIRAQFARGLSLTAGSVTTIIDKTPEVGPGSVDGDFYRLPVRIRWYANVPS